MDMPAALAGTDALVARCKFPPGVTGDMSGGAAGAA